MSDLIDTTPTGRRSRKDTIQLLASAVGMLIIASTYIGVAARYLWPGGRTSGQALRYPLNTLPFDNGVAGPVTYEFTKGKGDVAGVYLSKIDQHVVGLEQTCTHLGCPVSWDAQTGRFLCPCHGSIFSRTGQVLRGPAPRPLLRHEVEIVDNIIVVKGRI